MSLFARLRGRSFGELRERGAQAAARRAERWGLRDAREPGNARLLDWLGNAFAGTAEWRDHFAARSAVRLVAGFDAPHETAHAIARRDPQYAEDVVRRADAALRGRFDLLGYRDLDFGSPVDWHRDPVSGVSAPRSHWSTIDYLDSRVVGDHKVVWELNRQQWLVDLGAAWWLTGDARYAGAMVAHLSHWMQQNPPKRGVHWASSLEVALRGISWVWALEFLRKSPQLDAATFARLTKFLVLHAQHIERYLSTYFSPNTHLTGEALGLFYIGTYLPELRQSARWRERGAAILLEQLALHVRRDGVYFEQAVHYQRYTIDFYTHFWLLDQANGGTLRVEIAPHLEALLEHVQCLTRGEGTVPLYGDEDGGRLFFLDARPINDLRSALATGAVLFERADFAHVAGAPTAETLWLAGPAADAAFAALEKTPPRYASRAFEDGGVYVLRDGWAPQSNHLVIDCGPHGAMNCGHAHADALSFELALAGRAVFVDPGTYTYTASPADRDMFRSSLVHNTASLDAVSSSEPASPFHWRRIATSRVTAWRAENGGRSAYFEGQHDGYEQLPSPVRYCRAVAFHPESDPMIVIRDHFTSNGAHRATVTFQCAPGIEVIPEGRTALALRRAGATVCRLEMQAEGDVDTSAGAFIVDEGWVSPRYGARVRAPRCRYVTELRPGTSVLVSSVRAGSVPDAPGERAAQTAFTESR